MTLFSRRRLAELRRETSPLFHLYAVLNRMAARPEMFGAVMFMLIFPFLLAWYRASGEWMFGQTESEKIVTLLKHHACIAGGIWLMVLVVRTSQLHRKRVPYSVNRPAVTYISGLTICAMVMWLGPEVFNIVSARIRAWDGHIPQQLGGYFLYFMMLGALLLATYRQTPQMLVGVLKANSLRIPSILP